MSAFVEAIFELGEHDAQACADALLEAGALSVSVEDADAESPAEHPLFGEPGHEPPKHAWINSRLVAMFETRESNAQATISRAVAEVCNHGLALPAPVAIRDVDDRDWVRATQAQFTPIQIGRLWVVPSWHDVPAGATHVIRLDPGMAFGTGTHPTTRLCLQWLDRHLRAGASVLDYGCGSGILAIAAAMLGATHVEGVDIDPNAVVAARDNAKRNHTDVDFFDVATPRAQQRYDVVVANILSNPLKVLAPALIALVAEGGSLVLSGVLERQADEVAHAYAQHGFELSVAQSCEGWVCLSGAWPREFRGEVA